VVYVYADVEAKGDDAGALYRSDDAAAHFTLVNNADEIAQRGDDLVSLAVDPTNPQIVYLTNTSTYRSADGGKTLVPIKGAPGGDDYHTVWINPRNPEIVALASDQGATISVDGGATWSSCTISRRRRCTTSTPTAAFRIGSAAVNRRAARLA